MKYIWNMVPHNLIYEMLKKKKINKSWYSKNIYKNKNENELKFLFKKEKKEILPFNEIPLRYGRTRDKRDVSPFTLV